MGLMMCEGNFVGRDEIALVPTPEATASWKPVPHSDEIVAVTEVVHTYNWMILEELYGLARDGLRMFGVPESGGCYRGSENKLPRCKHARYWVFRLRRGAYAAGPQQAKYPEAKTLFIQR